MIVDLLARGWRRVHIPGQVAAQRYAIVVEIKAGFGALRRAR